MSTGRTIVAAFFIAMSSSSASGWEKLPPLPEPNAGFLGAAFRDQVMVLGGTNWNGETKRWLDRRFIFEPGKNAWRELSRLAAPLAYAANGADAGGWYLAGGSSGVRSETALLYVNRDFAVATIANLDRSFVYSAGALLEGTLYVIGGAEDQARIETMTNACWAIDVRSGTARRIVDLPGPGLAVGAAVACGGKVLVFGGCRWDSTAGTVSNLATAFAFSPAEKRWLPLPALPTAIRGLAAIPLDERRVLIAGGYKNDAEEFTDECFVFDLAAQHYTPAPPLPYRGLVGLVKAGDHVYCLGGEPKKKARTDAVYRIPIREFLETR